MNDSLKSLWTSSYCTNKGWIVVWSHSVSWHVCTPLASSSVPHMGPSTCVHADTVVPSLSGVCSLMPILLIYVMCWSINSCPRQRGIGAKRSGVGNIPITPSTQTSTAWVLGPVHYRYSCLLTCVGRHWCALGLLSLCAAFWVSSAFCAAHLGHWPLLSVLSLSPPNSSSSFASTVGHSTGLGDDMVLIEVVGWLRCAGSSHLSCMCTGHRPFGRLGHVLDVCTFRSGVTCSTPLESAPGHHLAHFPHLLILLIHLAPLHSPGNVQVVILASPLSTWTSVCGCYMAVAFLVRPAVSLSTGLSTALGLHLLASPPRAKRCVTVWACLVRVYALWSRMSAQVLMPGIIWCHLVSGRFL
jgi:hypothetical protein